MRFQFLRIGPLVIGKIAGRYRSGITFSAPVEILKFGRTKMDKAYATRCHAKPMMQSIFWE